MICTLINTFEVFECEINELSIWSGSQLFNGHIDETF